MADNANRLLHAIRQTCAIESGSNQPDLTLRQLAVLLQVYLSDEPQTVRGLATCLNIHKSGIGRALNRLQETDLAYREVDAQDRRSVFVGRTAQGVAMVDRLGAAMAEAANGRGRALSEAPADV